MAVDPKDRYLEPDPELEGRVRDSKIYHALLGANKFPEAYLYEALVLLRLRLNEISRLNNNLTESSTRLENLTKEVTFMGKLTLIVAASALVISAVALLS